MVFDFNMLAEKNVYCAKWKDFCPSQYIHTPVHISPRTPQERFPLHNHDFDELIYVYKGFGINFFKNQFKLILPGHVFFYQAKHYHAYPLSCDLHLLNILINKENFSDDAPDFQRLSKKLEYYQQQLFPIPLNYHDFLQLRMLTEKITAEALQNDDYSHLMISSIFNELAIIVLRSLRQENIVISAMQKTGFGFFKLLQADVLTNVTSYDQLRKILSKHQIHERKFKAFFRQITGLTPKDLILYNRILTFANLFLKDPQQKIEKLCYDSGFNDYRSFARNIKGVFNLSPKAFSDQLSKLHRLYNYHLS